MSKPKSIPPDSQIFNKICILHDDVSNSDEDNFTLISSLPHPQKRFEEILNIKQRRLNPNVKTINQRKETICNQIPAELTNDLGYHASCYRAFTRHSERLPPLPVKTCDKKTRSQKDNIIFEEDCLFCNVIGKKYFKKGSEWVKEDTVQFTFAKWEPILKTAEIQPGGRDEKLLTRIRGKDLFSV